MHPIVYNLDTVIYMWGKSQVRKVVFIETNAWEAAKNKL